MRFFMCCDASQPQIVAPICRKYGLGVEIQSFSNPEYPVKEPAAVQLHQDYYGSVKHRSLHGPFGDLSPGSCDKRIRQVSGERYEFAYHYAQKLEVQHVVLHHGYVPHTNSYAGWLKRSVVFWSEFLESKNPDITFYLENLLEVDPKLMIDVVRSVEHPNLKICLDVGHAFCHGKISVEKWIEELGDLIGYVHFHDNQGDYDAHLSLGQGRLPLDQVCYTLERFAPEAIWALEVDPADLSDSLFWLETHGYFPLSSE